MEIFHNYTHCKCSLDIRHPSTISEGLLDHALLHSFLWDCSKKARSKVCNTLPMHPLIGPKENAGAQWRSQLKK
jgi:hypothetical protein